MKINVELRYCLFDKPRALIETQEGDMLVIDREVAGLVITPAIDPLDSLRRWRVSGRELCHVPVVPSDAHEVMASEVDAKEYHLIDQDPLRSQLEAFRMIRSERAMGHIRRRGREPKA
jgi:hypothetical protein